MAIKIKGEIGWDVFASEIERQLNFASGDIEIIIDSPGGSVFEGISIADAIRNYKKGSITIKVILAASMATYISMFGQKLIFNSDSAFMIHNPATVAWGDYREMEKSRSMLEKLTNMFRNQYAKFTGRTEEEFKTAMDEERWYIGKDELSTWGEVLEQKEEAPMAEPEIIKASAMERISMLNKKMTKDYVKADLDKVATMLLDTSRVQMAAEAVNNEKTRLEKQEEKMDLNELKNKYPDIYNQAKQEGFADGQKIGVEIERQRVQDHMEYIDLESAKDMAIAAIKDGTPFERMLAKYSRLSANYKEISTMQANSPKDINPSEANEFNAGTLSVKDKAIVDEVEKGLSALGIWEAK